MIGGAGALVILLIVSVVVALLESEETFAADTPEGTVQTFMRALQEDDFQASYALLSAQLKETCTVDQLFGARFGFGHRFQDSRITHEDTTTVDTMTVVTVRIAEFRNDGPFVTSESGYTQNYTLRQEDGSWRFSTFPWPVFGCGSVKTPPPAPAVTEPTAVPTPQPK